MCGIAGIIGDSSDPSSRLARMLDAMAHRGPDGRGVIAFQGGAAGAVRLALVDLTDRGLQPLWSPDRRVAILFNGEMYNYAGERARLASRGHRFTSSTDTEVVLALYLEHGLDFVHHLRGMFALAILDWRESPPAGPPALLLARDPFGIKPLYLAEPGDPGGPLLFASEIRALLASGLVPREIDRQALLDYLALGFVLQPGTILAGVRMLERGVLARFTPDGRREQRTYWTLPPAEPRPQTLDQAAARLREVLEESVALHALADAPVGAFLSGGVDSAAVVTLMARRNPRLRTYTIRLPDVPRPEESGPAADLARSLGCEHTTAEITGRDVLALLPRFAAQIDQPSTDGLNVWLISRAAAPHVKGVLSGLGGDEWFAGYPVTRRIAHYSSGPGRLHAMAGRVAGVVRHLVPQNAARRRLDSLASTATPLATWMEEHRVFGYPLARRLVGLSRGAEIERILSLAGPGWRSESPLGVSCLLDVGVYMDCQLLRDSDAVSMANSLELRVPLVDVHMAEFARSCPDSFKLRSDGGTGADYASSGAKRVLLHALRDLLPGGIAQRPKRGFALPYDHWARHDLAPLVEETCRAMAARSLVDPKVLAALAGDHSSASRWFGWPQAWSIMILELWCRAVLDPAPSPHPSPSVSARLL